MIFVTTGTQEPFDRLLKLIAKFADTYKGEIIIQAKTNLSFSYNVKLYDFLTPSVFNDFFMNSDLIVSHAGMGTIISALYNKKAILIFPRKASLGEHRNDHQMATANKMSELEYVYVNKEENKFLEELKALSDRNTIEPLHSIGCYASESLIHSLEDFLNRNNY
jgi:UDP-N-acetylglucosamine transferase subunit ALG13